MPLSDPATLRALRRVFLGIFIVAALGFVALTAIVLRAPAGTAFDLQVAAQFFRTAADNDVVAQIGRILDVVGGNIASFVIVVVVFVLLRSRHHPLLAAYLLASALGGFLLSSLIKAAIERPRPPTVGLLLGEGTTSYPSGHATATVTVLGALAIIALALMPARLRVWVASAILITGAVIGLSRVWLGVHWPTDVIGGWLLGAAWTSLVAALVITTAIRE